MSSLLLWYMVFFSQPHKEERFIYPAYPLICLAAAFAIEMVQKALTAVMPRLTYFYSSLVLVFVIVFAFLSISRGLALYKGKQALMDHLNSLHLNACTQFYANLIDGIEFIEFSQAFKALVTTELGIFLFLWVLEHCK